MKNVRDAVWEHKSKVHRERLRRVHRRPGALLIHEWIFLSQLLLALRRSLLQPPLLKGLNSLQQRAVRERRETGSIRESALRREVLKSLNTVHLGVTWIVDAVMAGLKGHLHGEEFFFVSSESIHQPDRNVPMIGHESEEDFVDRRSRGKETVTFDVAPTQVCEAQARREFRSAASKLGLPQWPAERKRKARRSGESEPSRLDFSQFDAECFLLVRHFVWGESMRELAAKFLAASQERDFHQVDGAEALEKRLGRLARRLGLKLRRGRPATRTRRRS